MEPADEDPGGTLVTAGSTACTANILPERIWYMEMITAQPQGDQEETNKEISLQDEAELVTDGQTERPGESHTESIGSSLTGKPGISRCKPNMQPTEGRYNCQM